MEIHVETRIVADFALELLKQTVDGILRAGIEVNPDNSLKCLIALSKHNKVGEDAVERLPLAISQNPKTIMLFLRTVQSNLKLAHLGPE